MARLDWGKPFLFLYSRDDHLCDAAKLDGLIQEKRSRWVRVVTPLYGCPTYWTDEAARRCSPPYL